MADLVLPRGKTKVLKAEDKDYERGMLVKLLDDGGYKMAYWYDKPNKPYPVEIIVDGKSIKKDGKVVEMKFHPKDYYDKQEEGKVTTKEIAEQKLNMFLEKNVPTDASKWSYYKSQAKKKFDVYPSAYANGWAARQYKAAGGGWKKGNKMVPNCVKEVYDIYWENQDESCGYTFEFEKQPMTEAEYQGRKVKLGKIMQGDAKKFKVYVKNPKGNVVKVNFGQGGDAKGGTMRIRKSNPGARKSFRARHNCDTPGPRHKARYWSCRKW